MRRKDRTRPLPRERQPRATPPARYEAGYGEVLGMRPTGNAPEVGDYTEVFLTERAARGYMTRLFNHRISDWHSHNARRAQYYLGRGGMWVVRVWYSRESP